jgi:hypothetical protein
MSDDSSDAGGEVDEEIRLPPICNLNGPMTWTHYMHDLVYTPSHPNPNANANTTPGD